MAKWRFLLFLSIIILASGCAGINGELVNISRGLHISGLTNENLPDQKPEEKSESITVETGPLGKILQRVWIAKEVISNRGGTYYIFFRFSNSARDGIIRGNLEWILVDTPYNAGSVMLDEVAAFMPVKGVWNEKTGTMNLQKDGEVIDPYFVGLRFINSLEMIFNEDLDGFVLNLFQDANFSRIKEEKLTGIPAPPRVLADYSRREDKEFVYKNSWKAKYAESGKMYYLTIHLRNGNDNKVEGSILWERAGEVCNVEVEGLWQGEKNVLILEHKENPGSDPFSLRFIGRYEIIFYGDFSGFSGALFQHNGNLISNEFSGRRLE